MTDTTTITAADILTGGLPPGTDGVHWPDTDWTECREHVEHPSWQPDNRDAVGVLIIGDVDCDACREVERSTITDYAAEHRMPAEDVLAWIRSDDDSPEPLDDPRRGLINTRDGVWEDGLYPRKYLDRVVEGMREAGYEPPVYTCGRHFYVTDVGQCGACGAPLSVLDDPQVWLQERLDDAVAEYHAARAAGEDHDQALATAGIVGAGMGEGPIVYDVGLDGKVIVSGWIGPYGPDGVDIDTAEELVTLDNED